MADPMLTSGLLSPGQVLSPTAPLRDKTATKPRVCACVCARCVRWVRVSSFIWTAILSKKQRGITFLPRFGEKGLVRRSPGESPGRGDSDRPPFPTIAFSLLFPPVPFNSSG